MYRSEDESLERTFKSERDGPKVTVRHVYRDRVILDHSVGIRSKSRLGSAGRVR